MNFKVILVSTLLGCALLIGACESSDPSPVLKPFNADPVVAERISDFAFTVFQKTNKVVPSGENIFVSPLGLHIALGMLLNGATGETEEEIEKALKMHGVDRQQLNTAYLRYLQGLPEVDSKVKLHLANSIWHDKNKIQVNDTYQQLLKNSFLTESYAEDFSLTSTSGKINKWVSDKTQGKIDKVVDGQLDSDLVMMLMNAIYFKGDWQSKFDDSKTQSEDFFLQDGTKKLVNMMQGSHPAKVAITQDETVVQLGYGGGEFVMTLLLPKDSHTVDQLINTLDAQKWDHLTKALYENQVNVWLPRFKLESELFLNDILQEMGMKRAFSLSAQLDGISSSSLMVSYVKQKTFLQIDEKGSEAAAVTSIGFTTTNTTGNVQPLVVRFDKPFVVTISEKTSGSILFMGRIMNPDSE